MLCAHRAGLIDILSVEINLIMCLVTRILIKLTLLEKLRNHCTKLESIMLLPTGTRHSELHIKDNGSRTHQINFGNHQKPSDWFAVVLNGWLQNRLPQYTGAQWENGWICKYFWYSEINWCLKFISTVC